MNNAQRFIEDSYLLDWNSIKDERDWNGLLVGNGASCNIWDKFRYLSLYEAAQSADIEHQLSSEDIIIFEAMNTKDFERVLAALWTAETIYEILQQDSLIAHERYESIRKALIEAVHAVHIPWLSIPTESLGKINSALLPYQSIYSTNYDLLLYWAIMTENPPKFKDYFWSNPMYFDITNTKIFEGGRRILYLHGALHLVSVPFGSGTRKFIADEYNLLEQFGQALNPGEIPLFITEGNSIDKLASIRSSDYLSFAYEQFANHNGSLVIFGQSLGESDQHLIDAIKRWENCTIAISMRSGGDSNAIIERKARVKRQLPQAHIMFFDAETHPLGEPNLRITRNGEINQ